MKNERRPDKCLVIGAYRDISSVQKWTGPDWHVMSIEQCFSGLRFDRIVVMPIHDDDSENKKQRIKMALEGIMLTLRPGGILTKIGGPE